MSKNIVVSLLCVLVVVVVAVSTLPVFGAINSGAETIENEGAGALRFDLVDSHSGFNISYDFGDDHLTITNGSDVQTISYDSDDMTTIYYADDNVGIWLNGTDLVILGITSDNSTLCASITDDFTVQRTLSGVTITYGMESASFNAPSWAFIPNSAGKYGYFDAGTEVSLPEGARVAYVSDNFAGVYAYNGINNFDLPITLEPEISDNVLSGAKWIKVIEELEEDPQIIPFDPGITPINPNIPIVIDDPDDPIVIDDPNQNQLMAVPTPDYTDGDWGYNLVNGNATIVSYSGAGGGVITIPSTVGGHPVTQVGKGGSSDTVFDTSITATGLVIPEGVTRINRSAFNGCSGLTGTLSLPSTLQRIYESAFYGCSGFTGSLTLPSNLIEIGTTAFYHCSGFTGSLIFPSSLTVMRNGVFVGCTGFTGKLTVPSTVSTLGGTVFQGCTGFTELDFNYSGEWADTSIFDSCSGLTGTITLPDNIKYISSNAFSSCTNINTVILSENILEIGTQAFEYCTNLKTVIVKSPEVAIKTGAFRNCTNLSGLILFANSNSTISSNSVFTQDRALKSILNFGDYELSPSYSGLSADVDIRDYVNCMGYLAPVEYTTGSANDGPAYDLIGLIPLVFAVGAVLFTVGYMLLRKF